MYRFRIHLPGPSGAPARGLPLVAGQFLIYFFLGALGCVQPDGAGPNVPAAGDLLLDRYVARALLLNERHVLGEFGADSLERVTAALRAESGLTAIEIDRYIDSRQGSLEEWDAFLQDVKSNIK